MVLVYLTRDCDGLRMAFHVAITLSMHRSDSHVLQSFSEHRETRQLVHLWLDICQSSYNLRTSRDKQPFEQHNDRCLHHHFHRVSRLLHQEAKWAQYELRCAQVSVYSPCGNDQSEYYLQRLLYGYNRGFLV